MVESYCLDALDPYDKTITNHIHRTQQILMTIDYHISIY